MRAFSPLRRQSGQSLAEATVVLPLLLVLLLGTIELGRAANLMQTLDNAAREGAHYSAMPAEGTANLPSPSDVTAHVDTYLAAAAVNLSQATVNVNQALDIPEGGLDTAFTQVDVTYTYNFATPMLSRLVPSITLHGHAVMRNETN